VGFKARHEKARERHLAGPGLELRTWRMSDVPALFACVDRNRALLRQWMPWLDMTKSEAELEPFIRSCMDGYKSGSCYRLGVWVDGAIGGVVSLEEINTMHRRAKIGYWLSSEYQGRGLMTTAVHSLIAYAFETRGLETLGLRAATTNRRSRAVATRVGMKHEGTLRQQEWLYDHYVDHAAYTLLRSDWSGR
jgi:ribosomal-protein-serine acetyltransferase